MNNHGYCNNCGKRGHMFYQCQLPITSNGIIAFRKNPDSNAIEYLMIRRRHTLGFIDFMRGKYSIDNRYYIANMVFQMTNEEKQMLKSMPFDEIWKSIWGDNNQYQNEKIHSQDKFQQLQINEIIDESTTSWEEQEWGFPKGRKMYNETDLDCSIREFNEETGFKIDKANIVQNISQFEEIFCGSNYKSYKHKYFLAFMEYQPLHIYGCFEISDIKWKSYSECIACIRPYNLEKKRMISNIDILLKKSKLVHQ